MLEWLDPYIRGRVMAQIIICLSHSGSTDVAGRDLDIPISNQKGEENEKI
jgi:hypothetical protein